MKDRLLVYVNQQPIKYFEPLWVSEKNEKDLMKTMEYSIVKKAIKEAIQQIVTSGSWSQTPVVIVNYDSWTATKFRTVQEALTELESYCNLGDWCDRDLPFSGEDDEDIIAIKYCGGYMKHRRPDAYEDYKFYKKVDGVDIYRKKSLAHFQAEVSLSVDI